MKTQPAVSVTVGTKRNNKKQRVEGIQSEVSISFIMQLDDPEEEELRTSY